MNGIHQKVFGFLSICVRQLLRVRYKIKVKGLEKALSLKGSYPGVLFLPNHPAEVDPIILMSLIGKDFFPRSVVVEHFYYIKWFKKVLDFSRVHPIPSLEENVSAWKKKELAEALDRIQKEIKSGENYIIYPAGKLKRSGLEKLGGASFVYNILQSNPKIPVVLVRTTGLWGSSFSHYGKSKSPDFGSTLAKGFKALIKGGIFFLPKREVLVEFEVFSPLPLQNDRLSFNKALESWYNQYPNLGEEPVSKVPYSYFWKEQEEELKKEEQQQEEFVPIPEKVRKEVVSYLSSLAKIPEEKIKDDASLALDLGLDSLDVAEIQAFLDKRYHTIEMDLSSLQTVWDVLRSTQTKERKVEALNNGELKNINAWFEKKPRPPVQLPSSSVIQEVFLDTCDRMGSLVACGDGASGVISYCRAKLAVLVLANEFKKLPGQRIGVLLPSSSGTYFCILALLMAGKVPVMLNWTAGKNALNYAKKQGQFQVSLTSKKFLNKIYLEDLGDVEETFVFLEKIKEKIGFKEKIKALFLSWLSSKKLMEKWNISKDSSATAVLLFTSGTESLPKAVPLSHENILSNQRVALSMARFKETDSLHGVLPPFHSFGFSLTGLFPLLTGLKVFYAPDPTDGYGMAADIEKMQISTICLAPSFIRNLFHSATIEQLQSLRLVVSGAEKPSPELPAFVKKNLPKAEWIEGYGITECSPIVSLQPRGKEPKGVGEIFSNLEVKVIDPNSLEVLLASQEGEICISGPSVFTGYLGEVPSPFIEIEGKKWYRSGDLGRLDSQKNLYLTDRLKRTVKIGGEMLSLGAIEQELLHAAKERMWYDPSKTGPCLAILATKSDKPELVLFSTLKAPLEEINHALRERGLSRIGKISKVVSLSEIPLTGTGKVHYRMLEEKLR